LAKHCLGLINPKFFTALSRGADPKTPSTLDFWHPQHFMMSTRLVDWQLLPITHQKLGLSLFPSIHLHPDTGFDP